MADGGERVVVRKLSTEASERLWKAVGYRAWFEEVGGAFALSLERPAKARAVAAAPVLACGHVLDEPRR